MMLWWQHTQECQQIVKDVAEEKGVMLIDLDTILSGNNEAFTDHVHLTSKGGQMGAKNVAEFLAHELGRTD